MLELRKLYLDGFLSYDAPVMIKLNQPGLTYISGPTGAGKSTIFEAVLYLLTGLTLRDRGSVQNLINKVTNNGMDLQLYYTVDDQKYIVREVRDRGKESGLFLRAKGLGDLTGKTVSETRLKILSTLKMSATDFTSIAFLGQNQSQTLIEGSSAQRAHEIIRIFDLDKYAEALERCKELSRDVSKQCKNLEIKRAEVLADMARWQAVIDEKAQAEAPPTQDQLDEVQTKLDAVVDKLAKLKEREATAREVIAAAKAKKEQSELKEKLARMVVKKKAELQEYDDVQEEVEKAAVDALASTVAKMEQRILAAKQERESIGELGNRCPINEIACPVNVPKDHQAERIAMLDSRLSEFQKTSFLDIARLKSIRALRDRWEAQQRISKELRIIEKQLGTIKDAGTTEDPTEATEILEKCRVYIAEGKTLQESLRAKLSGMQVAIRVAQEVSGTARKAQEALAAKSGQRIALDADIDELVSKTTYLTAAERVIRKAQLYQIDTVRDTINIHLQRNLSCISDGQYRAVVSSQRESASGKKILDSIDITFSDGHKEIPISMASGGEKAQVGAALLFSIFEAVQYISKKAVSCLWLDEIFGPISQDTLDRVFIALADLIKRVGIPSVYIISHRDLPLSYFSRTWAIRMINGISHIELD